MLNQSIKKKACIALVLNIENDKNIYFLIFNYINTQ